MHELAVTESLLKLALAKAEEAEADRVTDLHLVIGQLSSFVDDSIAFYWDLISQDTLAEGASLHFRRVPARMNCQDCGTSYSPEPGELACPDCSGVHLKIEAGEEFYLDFIEIERTENKTPGLEATSG
ncbi:MAG: hydrogenase maturation nickel metallochaperone HypA [Anaerolineales bacterium]